MLKLNISNLVKRFTFVLKPCFFSFKYPCMSFPSCSFHCFLILHFGQSYSRPLKGHSDEYKKSPTLCSNFYNGCITSFCSMLVFSSSSYLKENGRLLLGS